jgi:glutathione synthase/RimK-type ligase-like ATP-grasp enzyme
MDADPAQGVAALPLGMARLSKLAFDGMDLKPVWRDLLDALVTAEDDAGPLMDLATLEQLFGNLADGLRWQEAALERRLLYRSRCAAAAPRLRLLALAASGDIGVNTPLEFLLEGADVALDTLYVVPGREPPTRLPEFDLAIVTVSEATAHRDVLAEIGRLTASWRVPVLNRPDRIPLLARDRLPALLADVRGLFVPQSLQVAREKIKRAADRATEAIAGCGFPLIVRPVDSHAGRGLARIAGATELEAYLSERPEAQFFIAPFIDYRSADGLYRKYRIAFVGGRPFACHMAITDQWMIYYLNAGMRESAAKRAEEAQFMRDFDDDFARRHAAALAAIAERVGLDYFAIDCAELADGRLLLFEADVAMIVHAMDPPDIFPYKGPPMRKLFGAFRAMLLERAGRA